MRSKASWRRAMRGINKRKKQKGPPKGIGGGKRGNIRGEFMEQMINNTLAWLEEKEKILNFRQEDGQRKDFVVFVKKRRGHRRCTIEVKSSERGKIKYMDRIEEMREKGKGKYMPADLVIVVNGDDDIFTLAERIVRGLDLS